MNKVIKLHPDSQAPTLDGKIEDKRMMVTLSVVELKGLIQEAVQAAISQNGHHNGDRLLDKVEAAKVLGVSKDWLYRHAHQLPFSRKLGPKMLRFSYQGITKWIASRKTL